MSEVPLQSLAFVQVVVLRNNERVYQPSKQDQSAFCRFLIRPGTGRNPADCGTHQGNRQSRYAPPLRAGERVGSACLAEGDGRGARSVVYVLHTGSDIMIQGSGFRFQDSGCRVHGSGLRVQVCGLRVACSVFRVEGCGFRVHGSGSSRFRIPGL